MNGYSTKLVDEEEEEYVHLPHSLRTTKRAAEMCPRLEQRMMESRMIFSEFIRSCSIVLWLISPERLPVNLRHFV